MAKDRWQELCALVEKDDGLAVREVGVWTERKLYFWNRYIDIATRAMTGKWGLVYVDLIAGPGVCRLKPSGRRIPGSALIAARAHRPFDLLLACEKSPELAAALRTRLGAVGRTPHKVFEGDCNELATQVASQIPDGSLTLAFVDPEALHVRFETIAALAARGKVDLLILLADSMDIVRNVDRYEQQRDSNLDRFLGPGSNWRQLWPKVVTRNAKNICDFFARQYECQLRERLGYVAFRGHVMESSKAPLYRLIFASKHNLAAKFWDEITKIDLDGQRGLFA